MGPVKVLSEGFWNVIAVSASLKDDERGGQGHTSANLLHHLPRDSAL
jgi:hypothetical protein